MPHVCVWHGATALRRKPGVGGACGPTQHGRAQCQPPSWPASRAPEHLASFSPICSGYSSGYIEDMLEAILEAIRFPGNILSFRVYAGYPYHKKK